MNNCSNKCLWIKFHSEDFYHVGLLACLVIIFLGWKDELVTEKFSLHFLHFLDSKAYSCEIWPPQNTRVFIFSRSLQINNWLQLDFLPKSLSVPGKQKYLSYFIHLLPQVAVLACLSSSKRLLNSIFFSRSVVSWQHWVVRNRRAAACGVAAWRRRSVGGPARPSPAQPGAAWCPDVFFRCGFSWTTSGCATRRPRRLRLAEKVKCFAPIKD